MHSSDVDDAVGIRDGLQVVHAATVVVVLGMSVPFGYRGIGFVPFDLYRGHPEVGGIHVVQEAHQSVLPAEHGMNLECEFGKVESVQVVEGT